MRSSDLSHTKSVVPSGPKQLGFCRSVPFILTPLSHPIQKLPSELLIAIFQSGESSSRDCDQHNIPFPVRVSHVCRFWRTVALDAGTLWVDIRVFDTRLSQEFADMYLERSKSCLLRISYHSHDSSTSSNITLIPLLISKLLPNIHRVRHLTIMAEDDTILRSAMAILKDMAAPRLESLRISLIDSLSLNMMPEYSISTLCPIFVHGAPLLRSMQLNGMLCFAQPEFTHLTSLTFRMQTGNGFVDLQDFYRFLSNISQTLTRLKIWEVSFFPDLTESHLPPIELPMLKSLNLSNVFILPSLYTPHLEDLYMNSVDDETMDTLCRRFLSSELSSLVYLRFEDLDLACFKGKSAVIHGLPLLTELVFWNCRNESSFLVLLREEDPLPNTGKNKNKKAKANRRLKRQVQTRALTKSVMGATTTSSSSSSQSTPLGNQANTSTELAKPDILPNLRFITISEASSWPLLQSILLHQRREGNLVTRVRSSDLNDMNTNEYEYRQMKSWLAERNIDYEEYDHDDEQKVDLDDQELMEEEECFQLNADEDDEDWSDSDSIGWEFDQANGYYDDYDSDSDPDPFEHFDQ